MQTLLHQTKQLREENKELQAQCQQWAPFKVNTIKVSKKPHNELLRHLSLGAQSSLLVATQDDRRKSLCRLVKHGQTKASALPKHQGK